MSAPSIPRPPAAGFFVDAKKGEVNELKQLLKNINVERDLKRKRDVIKKVIAYMTLGIDVSRLFTEMIMAIESKDIVIKKMVYLYLGNYAHKDPEMAIMCINSLRRECNNEDPMVRGLALRSLCNLRLESILEYVEEPVSKSLNDLSSYVRKVAVMGILKLHYLSESIVEENGWVSQLYSMLQDVDTDVVSNVLLVLNEMQLAQGGMEITQSTTMHLLNRIAEFNEWGLIVVLDLVARYDPVSEEETFAIMNLLDPVLRTANSGAVLGAIKCFMKLTQSFENLQTQIWVRAKPPLLTQVTGGSPEMQYAILKHLELILNQKAVTGVFDDEYRQLFVRYNEPPHVKHLKVDLLPLVANAVNARDIATELSEYVTDVDAELSKRAIAALGRIAIRIETVSAEMVQNLMSLVDLDIPYVRSEALIHSTNAIRIHPETRSYVLPSLSKCLRKIDGPEARSLMIWVIGEYCTEITEAPYMLEAIIDEYDEEQSVLVKLQLITATMKTFFQRAPETQSMLGRLLKAAINDTTDQDVHDRALLYYRLLNADLDVATKIFSSEENFDNLEFTEKRISEKRNKILKEFNTLAVVFQQPSSQFVDEKYQLRLDNIPMKDDTFEFSGASYGSAPVAQNGDTSIGTGNLLDMCDSNESTENANPALISSGSTPKRLVLSNSTSLAPPEFQALWVSLVETYNGQVCRSQMVNSDEIAGVCSKANMSVIASGPLPSGEGSKLFLYGQELDNSSLLSTDGISFLLQLLVMQSGEVHAMIKTTSTEPGDADRFVELLRSIF